MCSELCFEIPYPIGTNAAYKLGIYYIKRNGVKVPKARMFMSDEGKGYKQAVSLIARSAMNRAGFDVGNPKTCRLGWQLELYPSDLRKDTDGGIKLTKDAIADGLGINDRRFKEDHTYERPVDKNNPRAVVYIWKL